MSYKSQRQSNANGYKNLVEQINKGADINTQDKNGRTALHYAAIIGFAGIEQLIQRGADTSLRDNSGRTAQEIAASERAFVGILGYTKEEEAYGKIAEILEATKSANKHTKRITEERNNGHNATIQVS